MAKNIAFCGKGRAATGQIRQVSLGEQALPRRHPCRRSVCDRNGCVHDVSCAHHLLSPQSISVQRHDLGHDVCAARAGWRRTDRVDHGPHLLWAPSGKASNHEIDDLRLDEPRLLFERTRSQALGGRDIFVIFFTNFFTIDIQPSRRSRANRCWLRSAIVVMLWKSSTSSCWPTQPRGSPVTRAENRVDKSVSSCSAPRKP